MLLGMTYFPQSEGKNRAPRVRVPDEEPVSFLADGARMEGFLQKLSLTGGFARMARPCDAGVLAEIRITTINGPVAALVEILPPPRHEPGQPFRFVALSSSAHARLSSVLEEVMRKQGYAEAEKIQFSSPRLTALRASRCEPAEFF